MSQRLQRARLAAALALLAVASIAAPRPAAAWAPARVEPRVDNLAELLGGCEARRAAEDERRRAEEAWLAGHPAAGELAAAKEVVKGAAPICSEGEIAARLAGRRPGVWAMSDRVDGGLLFATVNLPVSALLVSSDQGGTWHYRHAFVRGFNVDRGPLLRGMDYRHGLLAVASEDGLLLSRDGGFSFSVALPGQAFWDVAISTRSPLVIAAGGEGTSYLTTDGGETWADLAFSRFVAALATRNRHVIDHITAVELDPADDTVYAGTGSHLYRFVPAALPADGRWQAMEGSAGGGRVYDDSTVYNIEIGSRFMISTCNGVYTMERLGPDRDSDHADVRWSKFRDRAFAGRGVGGPKGNLRSYFVAEDPDDPGRVLVADFAALYEGTAEGRGMRWQRVEELPYHPRTEGYPEYTSIAWTTGGQAVVGSRYQGIFLQSPPPRAAAASGPACFLR